MRWPGLAALLLLSPAFAGPQQLKLPIDEVWTRTSQAIVLRGFTIESSDRAAGLIRAKGSFLDHPTWFTCTYEGGILKTADFSLAIAVHAAGADTMVEMLATGTEAKLRYHHVLFFKTVHHWEHSSCTSTGELEAQLLERISTP